MLSVLLVVAVLCVSAYALRGLRRRRELEVEVSELRGSRVEGLTSLRNEQAFTEDLGLEVLRADRTGRPASLLVVNLDPELSPDEAGNGARKAVADVIRSAVRDVDVGYRIATDEFALILPETRARGALLAARRVDDRLRASGVPPQSVTIGIAELGPGIDRHRLFRNAYCALLAAGRDGRSPVLVYSPELERATPGCAPDDGTPRALGSSPGGEHPGERLAP